MSETRPIYRVLLDGEDIFDVAKPDMVLVNPSLTTELNTAGSFEFTLPPMHRAYDSVQPLTSTIEVYEDDTLLWFGRPVEIQKDYFTQKTVYCEGALAFCNDSVQRLHEYDEISLHQFFITVMQNHNVQVAEERRLYPGRITLPNKTVYRKLNYDSTFDVLHRQCLNAEGGYLFLRREGGRNHIDWLAEMPYTCNQPVEFGLNLLALSARLDGSSICTCVLPLGEADEETGDALTVTSVNNGSDVIESEAVSVYGRITKAVTFSGVSNPVTLKQDGEEYLQSTQFADALIECSASELHWKNGNYEQFRVGQMVRCHSVPHLLDREFPLTRLSIRLDTAAKQITLGTPQRQTLTRVYKENQNAMEQLVQEAANSAAGEELAELKDEITDDLRDELEDLIDNATDEELVGIVAEHPELIDDPDLSEDPGSDLEKLREELVGMIKTSKKSDLKPIKSKLKTGIEQTPKSVKDRISKVEQDLGGGSDGWHHWHGAISDYNRLTTLDPKTIYLITAVSRDKYYGTY